MLSIRAAALIDRITAPADSTRWRRSSGSLLRGEGGLRCCAPISRHARSTTTARSGAHRHRWPCSSSAALTLFNASGLRRSTAEQRAGGAATRRKRAPPPAAQPGGAQSLAQELDAVQGRRARSQPAHRRGVRSRGPTCSTGSRKRCRRTSALAVAPQVDRDGRMLVAIPTRRVGPKTSTASSNPCRTRRVSRVSTGVLEDETMHRAIR